MKIEVGAKIKRVPSIFEDCHRDSELYDAIKDLEGTIIDVNHKHKHFTVEYEFGRGREFRECFKFCDLQQGLR